MKYDRALIFLAASLMACEKTVDMELSDHSGEYPVAEGYITTSEQFQNFKIGWSTNTGSNEFDDASDFTLTVDTMGGEVSYTSLGNGNYISEIPFNAVPGKYYTISFSRNDTVRKVVTKVPDQVELVDVYFSEPWDGLNIMNNFQAIINSPVDQYVRFDLFELDKTKLPDTAWTRLNLEVYETFYLNAGYNYIFVTEEVYGASFFDTTDVVKCQVYSLSDDVAEYLQELEVFMEREPKGSRFENPPFYYSNKGYGLGYATCIDSIVVAL